MSSTTAPGARRKASSRAAAAQGIRRAAAAAGAVAAAAAADAEAAEVDDGPAGRRAWWPPASVAVVPGTREGLVADRAVDRSTRGGSKSAVRRRWRKVVRPAAVCGGTVCGGMGSCGCGGNSRVGGVVRRDRRTGCLAPADSGAPVPGQLAAVVAGTEGWRKPAATDSTTAAVADGTGFAARTGIRAASAPTST